MDREVDATDRSSIKPVSSLLSKWEGLNNNKSTESSSTPASPTLTPKPSTPQPWSKPAPAPAPKPGFKKLPPTPPAARRSLDVQRPTFAHQDNRTENHDSNKDPSRSLGRPRSPPKPRPLSMQVTPTGFDGMSKGRSVLSRTPGEPQVASTYGRQQLSQSPEKISDNAAARTNIARPADASSSSTSQATQQPKSATQDPIPKVVASKQQPPPVNRAAKRYLAAVDVGLSNGQRAGQDDAQLSQQSQKPGVSPFSTPPGDEEGSGPILEAPPVPVSSKPRAPSVKDPFEAAQEANAAKRASLALRPPRTSSAAPRIADHGRRRSKSDNVIPLDDDEAARPKLPPRRETPVAEGRAAPRRPLSTYGRQSLDAPARQSALSQGFSPSSYPPRADSQPSPTISSNRPRSFLGRRMSITPPPRAKPEPQFNRTYMKSSPVLAEATAPPVVGGGATAALTSATPSTWPDSSKANRRPPCHREGPRTIQTGLDSRLMDAYGEYVCASGTTTRVWHIPSGKLLLSMAHAEGVKITAVAFKPARDIEKDGQSVWLGTNFGELMELEVNQRTITAVDERTHSRREIIKMFRKAAEIWTLDNEGKLFVWPSNDNGTPNLDYSIYNGKASRGVTSSVVIGNKLWLAAGKSIRVFQPNTEPKKISFEVTTDPISVSSGGDITSSAHLPIDSDRVYLGHSDGKISIYSRKSNKHVETLSVSLYKVSCLAGVGDYLWAGFNNGTIMLFDTKTRPWTTKKYWQSHTNPVIAIAADKSSLWKSGRFNILSLGVDSTIGVWDGMLEDDWIQDDLQRREREFCTYKNATALVMTWNAGAAKPADLRRDQRNANFFNELLASDSSPDIIVFGFQELVDLEDKKLTAKNFFKNKKQDSYGQEHLSRVYREWRDYLTKCLDDCLPQQEGYVQLHTSSLVGLFTCVFVKSVYRTRIRDLVGAEVKTGMGGAYGNKGSLLVRFMLDDTAICLVNCHLAAGQTQTVHRNQDVQTILGAESLPPGRKADSLSGTFVCGGDGSMVMDHEICILNGDLNYRIDTMGRDTVVQAIKNKNLQKLLDRDQLLLSRRKNPDFRLRDFVEAPIDFLPTYKYDVGTDNYDSSDKRRAPAWCDRILTRGDVAISQQGYRRHEVRVSDHRPVSASFSIRVKSRQTTAFEDCRLASEQRFLAAKRSVADEAKTEYLKAVFGMAEQEARQLLKAR